MIRPVPAHIRGTAARYLGEYAFLPSYMGASAPVVPSIDQPGDGGAAEDLIDTIVEPASGDEYYGLIIGEGDVSTVIEDTTNTSRNQRRKKSNANQILAEVDFLSGEATGLSKAFNVYSNQGTKTLCMWMRQPDGYYRPTPGTAFQTNGQSTLDSGTTNLVACTEGTGSTAPDGNASKRYTGNGASTTRYVGVGAAEGPETCSGAGPTVYHWIVFYMKYVDHQWMQVIGNNSEHDLTCWANFDLVNDTVGNTGAAVKDAKIETVTTEENPGDADGWRRCSILVPQDTNGGCGGGFIAFAYDDTTSRIPTGATSGSVDVWRYHTFPVGCKNGGEGERDGEVHANTVWGSIPQRAPALAYDQSGNPAGIWNWAECGDADGSYGFTNNVAINSTISSYTGAYGASETCFDIPDESGVGVMTEWGFTEVTGDSGGGTGKVGIGHNEPGDGSFSTYTCGVTAMFFKYIDGVTNEWILCEQEDIANATKHQAWVNIKTGALGASNDAAAKAEVELCANGCARVFVTYGPIGATSSNVQYNWYAVDADGGETVDLDGTAYMQVHHQMIYIYSYNQTNPYCVAKMPMMYGSSWFSNIWGSDNVSLYMNAVSWDEWTCYIKFKDMAYFPTTGHGTLWGHQDTQTLFDNYHINGGWTTRITANNLTVAFLDENAVGYPTDGGSQKHAVAAKTDSMTFYVDGTQVDEDTAGTMDVFNRFHFGSGYVDVATPSMFLTIEEIMVTNKRLGNGKIAQLTT